MNLEQIDTSTTAGKAEAMRLAAEGRRVAVRGRNGNSPWEKVVDGDEPLWNWGGYDHAIIAKPVGPDELWFTVINGNTDAGPYTYECTAVDRAQNYGGQAVKYIRADLAGEKG